jgi:23S rRNA (uracil1939-C5)-methyltransferase
VAGARGASSPAADVIVDIAELTAAGDGVGDAGGVPIHVPFTIPGERVRVRLGRTGARAGSRVATLLEVLRPSPHRVAPRCRHFGPDAAGPPGPCGGCAWQHIAYAEQLRLKTDLVARLVRAAVGPVAVSPMLAATPTDAPWGFRHKVHFVLGAGDRGEAVMGHYARGSRRIIPVTECPVHDPRGNAVAFSFRDAYARARIGGRTLRGLAIRVGHHTGELMATLVVSAEGGKRLRAATRQAVERDSPTALHLNVHPEPDAFVFGRDTRRLSGTERMREEIGGVSYLVSPTAFFQTNIAAAERLVALTMAAIPATSRVLDLYAGAGLFALPLARAGHDVIAVEENREAVADGEASLRVNRLDTRRCRFIARRAESAIRDLARKGERFDAVVLDPPRDGCAPDVLDDVFGHLQPLTAVYISCNPVALGPDLRRIVRHGYTIRSVQPVDMFPHTPHVETVVTLTAGPLRATRPTRPTPRRR